MFRVQSSSDSGLKSDNHLHMYFSAFIRTCNETHHGSFSPAHPPALWYMKTVSSSLSLSPGNPCPSWVIMEQFKPVHSDKRCSVTPVCQTQSLALTSRAPGLTSEGQGREGHGAPLAFRFPSMVNRSEA